MFRVVTHLENLEKSGNLTVVREKSGKICSCLHKIGQLVFRKIIEIAATRCQILRLKCTKFDFGWGFAPDPVDGFKAAYF